MKLSVFLLAGLLAISAALPSRAAEIVFPQNRAAFFSEEAIELAVVGLDAGTTATVTLTPASGAQPLAFSASGNGTTLLFSIPVNTLAPGAYALSLDGKAAGKMTVSNGVRQSTMLVSQTAKGWSNFTVSNAFSFGLLDAQGQPQIDVRGKRAGTKGFETAIANNMPALCYMYWTGYVTHKPFGSEKSWANAEMQDAMRLLNFSVAQRMRPFQKIITDIGALDEPGLSWGPIPIGGMASGFPNHDEKPWYQARGWNYTQDIGNQSDEDWLKYMQIRCSILGESFAQAKADIKSVWPQAHFSTDSYALHAIMDGTDSLNQLPNDVPSSHVFFDFFGGPLSVPGQMQLEKVARPQSKLAHAMNGQLTGARGAQRPLYHLLMGGMLQGGLHSNWWLNTGGMTEADLLAVNKPAAEFGPLFHEMELKGYDTAVLWSYTEMAMRQKVVAQKVSTREGGQQPTMMLPLPDDAEMKEFSVAFNAYEEGARYCDTIFSAHQVLRRSGYPCQLIDERLIPDGGLKNYKTLVILNQTYPMSKPIMDGIAAFVKRGGRIVVDKSTSVAFPGTVLFDLDYGANTFRTNIYKIDQAKKAAGEDKKAISLVDAIETSLNPFFRAGIPAMKAAMSLTKSPAIVRTDAVDLSIDRQTAGKAQLISVLNGHEQLPTIADPLLPYPRYNPVEYAGVKLTLQGLSKKSVVYCAEGLDWKTVRKVSNPGAEQTLNFAPGEMKIFLVLPADVTGLTATAKVVNGQLHVAAKTKGAKTPWPVHVTVADPEGKIILDIFRAVKVTGTYQEVFPMGANVNPGEYLITVQSLFNPLMATSTVKVAPIAEANPLSVLAIADTVRIFDEQTISNFLKEKPAITIAVENDAQRAAANKLALAFQQKGLQIDVKPVEQAIRRMTYPRVWNPTVSVVSPNNQNPQTPPGEVKQTIRTSIGADGIPVYLDDTGKSVLAWRIPLSVIIVGEGGLVDFSGNRETCYEAGIHLYINEKSAISVLNSGGAKQETVTAEFRAKWQQPWTRLSSHAGAYQLPPSLPEAFTCDSHLIVIGDSSSNYAVRVLQASEIIERIVDAKYPGPGKALIQYVWSPFAVEKNVIYIGASDTAGINAGTDALITLLP